VQLLHVPVMLGMSAVLMPQFALKDMLEVICKYKLTFLHLVPRMFSFRITRSNSAIIIRLLKDPLSLKYDLSHVTRFASGAAPLPIELLPVLHERYPQAGLWQGCKLCVFVFSYLIQTA